MTFKLTKDYIQWNLREGYSIFYIWWGIDPWWEMKEDKMRVFEFGIGARSWELFKFKV